MNKGKRLLSLILLICILIPLFSFFPSLTYAAIDTEKYQGYVRGGGGYPTFSEFLVQYGFDYKETLTRDKDTTTYYLNIELYVDKQLIVYTTIDNNFRLYNPINTGNKQDFKETPTGYFTENGKAGLYRYLGYSPDGIIMSNRDFPNDYSNNPPVNESNWIQFPWEKTVLSSAVREALKIDTSYDAQYLEIASASDIEKATLRDNLGAFVNDNSESVSFALGSKMSVAETYGMILSKPTMLTLGSFRLFKNTNGNYRYNTFDGVLTKKEFPELTSNITTDKTKYTLDENKDTVEVLVTVNGHLQDDLYYNDNVYEMVYYNRRDVSSYDFNLTNSTNKYPRADTTNQKINKPSKQFKVTFNRTDLNEGTNTIQFNSNTTASFLGINNEKFNSLANTNITIDVVPKTNGVYMSTEMIVDPSFIEFKDNNMLVKVTLKAELKNYTSTSNISKWEMRVKKDGDPSFTTITVPSNKLKEEAEFTFTIPKTVMASRTEFEQFFTGNATVVMKAGSNIVSNDVKGSTIVWKVSPNPLESPPIVSIIGPRYVQAGDVINLYGIARPQEPGATISSYYWRTDSPSGPNGYSTKDVMTVFINLGNYYVYLDAVDSNGLMGTGIHPITVTAPYPYAIINHEGGLKENRRIKIDGTKSLGNAAYPINWSKSYWLIEPVGEAKLVDLLFNVPASNMSYTSNKIRVNALSNFDIQSSVKGEYKFTLYVENTYGNSSTSVQNIEIQEDLQPEVNFSTVNTILREPNNYRKATMKIHDLSRSIDEDSIASRSIKIYYNSNNGVIKDYDNNSEGISHNGSWELIRTINTTNTTEVDFTHEVHDVGKYKVEITATEKMEQPTFANGTYRKLSGSTFVNQSYSSSTSAKTGNTDDKDINEKVIEVINIAPSTDLLVAKTGNVKKVDIVINAKSTIFEVDEIRAKVESVLKPAYDEAELDYTVTVLEDERLKSIPKIIATNDYAFVQDYMQTVHYLYSTSNDSAGIREQTPTTMNSTAFSYVSKLKDVKDISIASNSTSSFHGIEVKNNGDVYTWGNNTYGQLGNGNTTSRTFDNKYKLNGVKGKQAFAEVLGFSIVLDENGSVYTFGRNASGQMGDGTTTNVATPKKVLGLPPIKKLSVFEGSILALTYDGDVYSWGTNNGGQLGTGTTTNKLTPSKVGVLNNITDISVGATHGLALAKNGDIYGWGINTNYRLGTLPSGMNQPRKMSSLTGLVSVYATDANSYFFNNKGEVYRIGKIESDVEDGYTYPKYVSSYSLFLSDVDMIDIKKDNFVYLDKSGVTKRLTFNYQWSYNVVPFSNFNTAKEIFIMNRQGFSIDVNGNLKSWGYESANTNLLGQGALANDRTLGKGDVYTEEEGRRKLEDIVSVGMNVSRSIVVKWFYYFYQTLFVPFLRGIHTHHYVYILYIHLPICPHGLHHKVL